MRKAEAHQHEPELDKRSWFIGKVNSYGPWDYKNVPGLKESERIEDFGNFNYGATGAALGISEEELHRAAGAKQILDHWKDSTSYTNPLGYPYGDDRRDAAMIRRGIEYYERWQRLRTLGGFTK